jgi:hypothetical protein
MEAQSLGIQDIDTLTNYVAPEKLAIAMEQLPLHDPQVRSSLGMMMTPGLGILSSSS